MIIRDSSFGVQMFAVYLIIVALSFCFIFNKVIDFNENTNKKEQQQTELSQSFKQFKANIS